MTTRRIRLAVVDDSAFVRKAIRRICESEDDVQVVGVASSGEELLAHLAEWKPDAVTLDLSMPGIGGLATLDRILTWKRVPVIILSAHSRREAPLALEALSRGATDFIDKEELSLVDFESLRRVLMPRLRQITGFQDPLDAQEADPPKQSTARPPIETSPQSTLDLIVIGASTGGPPAIEELLRGLDPPLDIPIAIVQHMPTGFTAAFADRLNANLPMHVYEATHASVLRGGDVAIAPGGTHLRVREDAGNLVITLSRYPETAHRPSVDVLFRSVVALGPRVVAVLLTGMGDDGARGMVELMHAGASTIAQDEATCVVWGMPRAATLMGGASEQLPIGKIAARLRQLATRVR
jgi:two-component system, chemotaxis family, protein-glutamate methylesterase/glutaminase